MMGLGYNSVVVVQRKSFRQMLKPSSSCVGGRGPYGVYMLFSLFIMAGMFLAKRAPLRFMVPTELITATISIIFVRI